MSGDGERWAPARPSRGDFGGDLLAGPASRGGPEGAPDPDAFSVFRPPRRRPTPRRSPSVRLLLAYAALAVVTAVVIAAGAAVTPTYGSLPPMSQARVPDFRTAPVAAGWRVDLARALAPEAPPACVSVRADSVDPRHELVTAAPEDRCGVDAAAARGRLVLLDTVTGRVVWRRDLGAELGLTVASLVWHADAGRILVGVDGAVAEASSAFSSGEDPDPAVSPGTRLLTLSAATGKTESSTEVSNADQTINFGVTGDLVLSAFPASNGVETTYWLRRADRLDRIVWSQTVSGSVLPELLPDRLLIPLTTGTNSIDGTTGDVTAWGFDLQSTLGARVVGDRVLAVTTPTAVGGAGVVLLDSRGRPVWRHAALGVQGLSVSRDCVVQSSTDDDVTCLDLVTGRFRWSSNLPGSITGTPDGAATADVLSIGPVSQSDDELHLTSLDSVTGSKTFETTVPRSALVVAEARTVGYAIDRSGKLARLVAFDLHDGERLYEVSAPAIVFWGDRLVELSNDGVAREYVGAHASPAHGKLDG